MFILVLAQGALILSCCIFYIVRIIYILESYLLALLYVAFIWVYFSTSTRWGLGEVYYAAVAFSMLFEERKLAPIVEFDMNSTAACLLIYDFFV